MKSPYNRIAQSMLKYLTREKRVVSYYIIVRGAAGSGKTAVAKRLARMLDATYISVDAILRRNGLEDDWEDGYISQRSFMSANAIIEHTAKASMMRGKPVVVDGNFYWQSQIEDIVRRLGVNHYAFKLEAPLERCIARDRGRNGRIGKDAVIAVYKKTESVNYGVRIDATMPMEKVLEGILACLPE